MKKHVMVGMAVLACSVSAAWAESSVTIFGFIDASVGKETGSSDTKILDKYGSRLGVKGERELGNGLTGSFYLEHRLDPQTGASQGGSDTFWKGGSWVGLGGAFGKVTLGRWWSQAFLKSQYASDPFGMGTVDETYGTVGCGPNTGCVGAFWVNNSVSYEFSASGFSFGAQVAETPAGGTKRPANFGVSYSQGALYLGLGYESGEACCATAGTPNDATWAHGTVNYDFGVVKLFSGLGVGRTNTGNNIAGVKTKVSNIVVGFTAPVGSGKVIGAFNQFKDDSAVAGNSVVVRSKVSLGYQYDLDKSTKLYATVSNDSKAATSKTGYDLGVMYSF
ncbi:MAG TPA: porin [Albitalea sp.]|nr:porin [Albitalea sp.]